MSALGRVLARAGVDTRNPFYSTFVRGWEAELKAYEADLTARGRSNFHYRRKLRSTDPAEQRRKLKEMVK